MQQAELVPGGYLRSPSTGEVKTEGSLECPPAGCVSELQVSQETCLKSEESS